LEEHYGLRGLTPKPYNIHYPRNCWKNITD